MNNTLHLAHSLYVIDEQCKDITDGKLKAMFDGSGPNLGDQLTNERKSGRSFVGYQGIRPLPSTMTSYIYLSNCRSLYA
jgi:hypothetical protein